MCNILLLIWELFSCKSSFELGKEKAKHGENSTNILEINWWGKLGMAVLILVLEKNMIF